MNAFVSPEIDIPLVRLVGIKPTSFALRLVPYALAQRYSVLPIAVQDSRIVIACASPNTADLRAVSQQAGRPLRVNRALYPELRTAIANAYGVSDSYEPPLSKMRSFASGF